MRGQAFRAIEQFRFRQKIELLRRGLEDESAAARGSSLIALKASRASSGRRQHVPGGCSTSSPKRDPNRPSAAWRWPAFATAARPRHHPAARGHRGRRRDRPRGAGDRTLGRGGARQEGAGEVGEGSMATPLVGHHHGLALGLGDDAARRRDARRARRAVRGARRVGAPHAGPAVRVRRDGGGARPAGDHRRRRRRGAPAGHDRREDDAARCSACRSSRRRSTAWTRCCRSCRCRRASRSARSRSAAPAR